MNVFGSVEYLVYAVIVVPVLAYAQAKTREYLEKRDAWKDAQANPYVKPGRRFNQLKEAGNPTKVCGAGMIHSVERGRIEIVQDDDGGRMVFTLREFKALHPEWSAAAPAR